MAGDRHDGRQPGYQEPNDHATHATATRAVDIKLHQSETGDELTHTQLIPAHEVTGHTHEAE